MIKLSIERTWWFADQFYSGLFMQWNRISRIHSLLVACDVKIWRKYSLFTSVFDINGKEVETSNYRSNHPDVFCRKCVLKNYSKFSRNQLCQSFSFNKVADPRPIYRCFGRDVLSLFRIDVLYLLTDEEGISEQSRKFFTRILQWWALEQLYFI